MIRRLGTRALAIAAAAAFLGGLAVAVLLGMSGGSAGGEETAPATRAAAARPPRPKPATTQQAQTTPRPKPARPVPVAAVAAYDPEGDGHEKDDLLSLATDGDPTTAWTTERYDSWGWKQGVGIVVRTDVPVRLARLVVVSDTPGFRADVRAGEAAEGPFTAVSPPRTGAPTTVFPLRESAAREFHLLWITQLHEDPRAGGAVRIAEIHAFAAR